MRFTNRVPAALSTSERMLYPLSLIIKMTKSYPGQIFGAYLSAVCTLPATPAIVIADDFSSGGVTKNSVRFHENDIDGGWHAPSGNSGADGTASAWTISGGTLNNSSTSTGPYAGYVAAEGAVVQMVSVAGQRGGLLSIAFEYAVASGDQLYVGLIAYDGTFDLDADFLGNFEYGNGNYGNLVTNPETDETTNVIPYSLLDGTSPGVGGSFTKIGPLNGSGTYRTTIDLAALGINGIADLGDLESLGVFFAKDEDGSAGSTSIDNLQIFSHPAGVPDQKLNYSYLYFENGYPTRLTGRRPQSDANLAARANPDLVFQTGYYSLMLDCDDIALKGYDALGGSDYLGALDQDVATFTPTSSLLLRVFQGGIAYDCTDAVVQGVGLDNIRLIESGQYVQRIDHLGLVFKAANGDTLVVDDDCRLEVTAWPDRVTLMLDFSSETTNPVTQTTIQVVSPAGNTHLVNRLSNRARLTLKPQDDVTLGAMTPSQYITEATNLQNGLSLAVNFDEDEHAFHIEVPADPVSYPAHRDRVDEYLLEVTNPSTVAANVPLVFEQPIPRKITGTVMVLCEESDGRPLGIPVQISKNWHRDQANPTVHEGPWLRGSTMLTLGPGESRRFTLRVVYGFWGGAGAVSHAQLSLIGWGCNWKWHEAALGAWGESITYDPSQHAGSSFMADIRPTFTEGYTTPHYNWTENVGGADFLVYRDSANNYRWGKRMKTCFHRTGPNLTEVHHSGVTDDDRIRFTYRSRAMSTSDYHRRFHAYKYEFLQDVVSPQRLVFHQLAADYYFAPAFTDYHIGDESGLLLSPAINAGGNTYKGAPISFDGKWLSIDDTIGGGHPAKAMRGLIPVSSTLNGSSLPLYLHTYGRTWGSSTMLFDLAGASVNNSYSAGDEVAGELELVLPPQHVDNYWGSDPELVNRLTAYGDTAWEPVRDELKHNVRMNVAAHQGTLLRHYPVEIQPSSGGGILADFTITSGGLGHLPVVLKGAAAALELRVQRWVSGAWVDLESVDISANNYYQGAANADGSMDYIFSIPRPSFSLDQAWRVRVVTGSFGHYYSWASGFGVADTEAGPSANPDHDAWTNLGEYALGGNPTEASTDGHLPILGEFTEDGTQLVYTYFRRRDAAARGLVYRVQTTSELQPPHWTTEDTIETGTTILNAEFFQVTNLIDIGGRDRVFVRLEISLQD